MDKEQVINPFIEVRDYAYKVNHPMDEDLRKEILEELESGEKYPEEYYQAIEEYQEEVGYTEGWTIEDEKELEIQEEFTRLYREAISKETFFYGCNIDVFFKSYEDRLEEYLRKYNLKKEIDFILVNLEGLFGVDFENVSSKLRKRIEYQIRMTLKFLYDKSSELGYAIKKENGFLFYKELSAIEEDERGIIDESQFESSFTIGERIIMLNELGILELLNDKANSVNKIAMVLSHIMNEKASSIQSYINPIISKGVSQSKSPYSSKGAREKIVKYLNIEGF